MFYIDIEKEKAEFELKRDRTRWKTRRRIAIISFIELSIILCFYMLVGLYVGDEVVKRISEFNSVTITIIGALISIVLSYFGLVYMEDKLKTS